MKEPFAKKPKRKAIWTLAFPDQVQRRAKELNVMHKGVRRVRPSRKPKPAHHKAEREEYRVKAREFVARDRTPCPVMLKLAGKRLPRTEVHHVRGRLGSLLLDDRFWLAVSAEGHRWIHDHYEKAREYGWICAKGEWNTPPKNS